MENPHVQAVMTEDDQFLGIISLKTSRYPDLASMELGYWLVPEIWGQGIGKIMISKWVQKMDEAGIGPICAATMKTNTASQKLLEHAGFKVCSGRPNSSRLI